MSIFQKGHAAVDKETGENLTELYEKQFEQDEARRKQQAKYFEGEAAKNAHRNYHGKQAEFFLSQSDQDRGNSYFIFLIYTPVKKFLADYPHLTKGDYARLVYLSTFLKRNGTEIKYNKMKLAEVSDVKKMLDINERTCQQFIMRAKESGLMYLDDDNKVNLSDKAFKNGRIGKPSKSRHFSKLYINNTRALYHAFKKGKAIEKLGTLYSLIPYLDLRYNVLAANANERIDDISDLQPLNMREVADILEVKEVHSLRRTLHAIKVEINGLKYSLVATHETGATENALIAINPFFIYRDDQINWMEHETHLIFMRELMVQVKDKLGTDIDVEEIMENALKPFELDYEMEFK